VEPEELGHSPFYYFKSFLHGRKFVLLILAFSFFAIYSKFRFVLYIFALVFLLFCLKWILKYVRHFIIFVRNKIYPSREYRPYEFELMQFIENNKYPHFFPISYIEFDDSVVVRIEKDGGKYQADASNSDEKLAALLNMELFKKKDDMAYTEYYFNKYPIQREEISGLEPTENREISVYGDIKLNLNNSNFSTLISGVSGSGKSYLLYSLMGKFASQVVTKKIGTEVYTAFPKLYVIDPKRSVLYKNISESGISDDYLAYDVKGALRIARKFLKILDERMEIFAKLKADDSEKTFIDLHYEPCLLVIDEYPSLIASMDKKQREDFEKYVGNISRLGRSLSMGVWCVLQQAASSVIDTGVREQLVNKVFLGNPSQQSAQMVFGCSKSELPLVNGVGAGIISIDGKEPKTFLSPSFVGGSSISVLRPILKLWAESRQQIDDIEMNLKIFDKEA
ncbi:MAG: hypothetical protein ABF526_11910, partial [Liquorilactobacillus nagelii]|uniref:hypothetical protein n=1 Tax=Liquorilactobacillus nagelii TaxID=82688 RepID=UPI0039EBDBD1